MRKDERGRVITLATIREGLSAEEWQLMQGLIEGRGEQWVIDNWTMLEDQLEYVRTLL